MKKRMMSEWGIRNWILELLKEKHEGLLKPPYKKGTKIDIQIKTLRAVLDGGDKDEK